VGGLSDTWSILAHDGWQRGIQVDMTPTGARRLFGLPMSELAGHAVALRDVLPKHDREWLDRLAELPDWSTRLDVVEGWLARALSTATVDTRRVDAAVERITSCGGALRTGPLARDLGCSPKHLVTLFRDQVGVPPKLFAQLVRFEQVMERACSARAARWIELALDAGYCDQAHLARDVRRFTGLTPTAARAQYPDLVALLS
jgi:AraC-like DNA-binding protein